MVTSYSLRQNGAWVWHYLFETKTSWISVIVSEELKIRVSKCAHYYLYY